MKMVNLLINTNIDVSFITFFAQKLVKNLKNIRGKN